MIDGSIGEGSPFEREFGYFAHGVGPETAVLPKGWLHRVILIAGPNTRSIRGLCLEVYDLAVAKLVAVLGRNGKVRTEVLQERAAQTVMADELRPIVAGRIRRI